jgi:hypothetical protein
LGERATDEEEEGAFRQMNYEENRRDGKALSNTDAPLHRGHLRHQGVDAGALAWRGGDDESAWSFALGVLVVVLLLAAKW